jgi:tripartite-type tricarboxylate transporter receptor subunit TctC
MAGRESRRSIDARWPSAITVIAGLLIAPASARGQDSVARFYKGKTVTIVVGTTAGGGYDTYARFIARFLPKHIPGNPAITVSNMPGAGSNIAALHIYSTAPKDGTWIGAIFGGAILEPLIGTTKIHHDPNRFQYLGSANDDVYVCLARKDAPVKKIEDAMTTELIVGASMASSSADFATMLNHEIHTKFREVVGYNGSRPIMLAMEKNEVQGACGFAWPSINVTNPNWFGPEGMMRVLAQTHVKGYPALNAMGIPLARDFAKTDEEREVMDLYFSHTTFGRPYLVAPEVPKDRVEALRKAFMATMTDPEFIVEARKAGLDIDAVDGPEVQRLIGKIYAASPDLIAKVKRALQPDP